MSIQLKDLTKRFGPSLVVDRFTLEVADGELFVLLGPSGSGKSTVLRLVAGLTPPDGGAILLHGSDVTNLPPRRRDVGFIFQNYSVFRHMTVGENVEFALRIRGVAAEERARRRDELLELVGLGGFAARDPRSLSGGQLQRVALARGLAHEPKVLLLDEPFGALDVKIRAQLRRSLREIQRSLKVTTILVTHDQEEAFELGDRIGIIDEGRLLEVGSGEELYRKPQSGYAATFVGSGTVLVGRCRGHEALLGPVALPIPPETPHEDGAPVRVLVRPENVLLLGAEAKEFPALGRGEIIEETFVGAARRLRLRLPRLPGVRQIAPVPPFGEEGLLIDAAVLSRESPPAQPWVALRDWHILRQPRARLLVAESGAVSPSLATIAAQLRDAFEATVRVLRRETPERASLPEAIGDAEEFLRPGDPVEEALAEQERTAYDFLLLPLPTTDPRLARARDRAGTLLARLTTPTLLHRGERARIARILICTAVGEPGKSDVRVGGWLARRLGASVLLLHVSPIGRPPAGWVTRHLEAGLATLRSLDVDAVLSVRESADAAAGILAAAKQENVDLIVVGGHGPSSWRILRADDVTLRIVRGSDRPILVVPEPDGPTR